MLPGSNNVVGLWPAVWAMGNLGRVGYGASLEGVVSGLSELSSPSCLMHFFSGRTLTTRVMLAPYRTRHSTACLRLRLSTAIPSSTAFCHSSKVNASRAARAKVSFLLWP
jgi:beta-glucanase (GH16 family)